MFQHALLLGNRRSILIIRVLFVKIGQIFTALVFLVALLAGSPMSARADAPGSSVLAEGVPAKVVLIEPHDNIGDVSDPTYKWNPASGAEYYQLGLVDPTGAPYYSDWIAATSLCDASVCSALHSVILPSATVIDGQYTWYVQGYNTSGPGLWSDPMVFTIESGASGPNTTITSKPPNPSASLDASFQFTSTLTGSTFECKLDSGSFASCTSLKTYTGLSEGSHTFQVRASNGGQTDPTPASYTWVINTSPVPPKVVLIEPQGNIGNVSNPTYKWNRAAGAENYMLGLIDPTGAPYYSGSIAAADVCDTTVCSALHSDWLPAVTIMNGQYTWYIQGYNASGMGPWSDPMTFTVDSGVVPPDTTITSQPINPSNTANASFQFTSTLTGSTFECKLDSGSFASCTSPKTYTGLSDGSHTFQVRAVKSGITDATPASYTWTIDTAAPNTTITSQPANPSSSASASFQFTSTLTGSTFECKLDSGAFASCTSPRAYTSLSDGSHTFQVRAIRNGITDATPASYTWTIDTAAPNTTITSQPANPSSSASASFQFTGSEPGSTFECKLDSGAFASCTSPRAYSDLTNGSHTFQVQARDAAGNVDATPATYTWMVNVPVVYGAGIYDDGHVAWTYTGVWSTFSGSGPYSSTLHQSRVADSSAEVYINGGRIRLTYLKAPGRGSIDVFIDGSKVTTLNANSSGIVWQATWTSQILTAGNHTVRLVNAAGGWIDLDAIQVFAAVTPVGAGTYDDANAAWSYTGVWSTFSGSGPYSSTLHQSNVAGSSAELIFSGARVKLTYLKAPGRGSIDVFIDGSKVDTLNANSSGILWQATWTSAALTAGNHTVSLVNAAGGWIDLDAIQVFAAPTALGTGTYDDAHDAWFYSGTWNTFSGSGPYSSTLHQSNVRDSYAEVLINGAQVKLTYLKAPGRGSIDVFIDESKVGTLNANSSGILWQATWTSPVFSAGNHTVRLVNATDGWIDLDAIQVFAPVSPVGTGTYDDAHAAWSYSGTWSTFSGSGPYSSTLHQSNTVGNYAQLPFNGVQVKLTYLKAPGRGSIDVLIDGTKVTTLNASSTDIAWQATWTSASLTAGNHTIRLVNATGGWIDLDAVQVNP